MRPSDAGTDLSRFVGTWTLDPDRTAVTIRSKSMWILPVKGVAKALSGVGRVSSDGRLTGSVIIDAGSFDTGNQKRDAHLCSKDFFDTVTHPTIAFHASEGRPKGPRRVEVTGVLEVRGQQRPLTLQADVIETADSAIVSTEVEVDRSRWGMTWGTKMGAGLKTRVTVSAHFVRTK